MWSLINIKETVNMQMWYLVIYFKIAGVLKTNIFGEYGLDVFFFLSDLLWQNKFLVCSSILDNKDLSDSDDKKFWNACTTCN